ncbi:GSCFA domain-containing protein [Pseudochryseolinea flava]|uniref:GSCFA domain-containing protein n=1 Tax=Pseudochryseolinea flava TaxID=2059302 RepID=A0A364XZ70_9BACT|nr:GSCFA domain-containing protein [Pseudochryseolinea flava]RAV99598.1 hypothetical protein DQQ10_18535 [Pseudochryseolinea flava]
MTDFRTIVRSKPEKATFGLHDKIFTTGSCFAEAIGSRLAASCVDTHNNAFGTTYNPHSIHKNLRQAIANKLPPPTSYLVAHDIHLNFDFHSTISAMDKVTLTNTLTDTIERSHRAIKNAQWLLITYGTAWVYRLRETGEIVSNCHKQPGAMFEKSLLPQKDFIESFDECYQALKACNPSIKIIVTVSPVRHIKDTIELNGVSKAILRLSCHTICEQYPDVWYFPAYEIMMDDLRDYRFYAQDMLHPTQTAEDYIWDNFIARFADNNFKQFYPQWRAVQMALKHRPFHPQSTGHQIFIRDTIRKLEELSAYINVDKEIDMLTSQLIK